MTRSWKHWSCQFGLIACLGAGTTVVEALIAVPWFRSSALAQVTPDGTLNTTVNAAGNNFTITNGTARGNNLFHSFGQFSIPTGGSATFDLLNTPNITTIFSRVTGGSASDINGLIETVNSSNPVSLFLMNPNGIIFGPDAKLDIGGAFVGTTATRIKFADGTEFSAQSPASTPLLTISTPIGLQFGQTPGEIRSGLRIGAGINSRFADFALVGGDVTLDNSFVFSPGRRIEFMGVDENGMVGLQMNGDRLSLSLAAGTPRRDITFNGSFIAALASSGGGEVVVTGRNIFLNDGSTILTGILRSSNNAATNRAGDITINATANLQLTQDGTIINQVSNNAIGQGGNVRITASDVRVRDGSQIGAGTFGTGNAGNVQVTANTIALDGTSPDGRSSGIFSQVGSTGNGSAGDVIVETGSLSVTNGARVSASTVGTGDAGDVRVTANTIDLNGTLDGTLPDDQSVGIFSQVGSTGNGSGGDVTVETGSLSVSNGARVSASTVGTGDAGDVRVTANTIDLNGTGSGILSEVGSTGVGSGGDVTVETGSLSVSNGARVSSSALGNGSGGDVTVETGSLSVTNRAAVSSSALGNGSAGSLDITARTLRLDRSFIAALASSGDGANITLNVPDLLLMRNGSQISTSTGFTGAGGNGGNITITAPNGFLVTAPNENNDITANAFNGSGGRVTIDAQAIYWFTPRSRAELVQLLGTNDPAQLDPFRLPTNDITAISQGNPTLNGVITLNTPDVDPNRGLVVLPAEPTTPQVAEGCQSGSRSSSRFVVTGRGGLPPNPSEALSSEAVEVGLVTLDSSEQRQAQLEPSTHAPPHTPAEIVEAQGWQIDRNGEVVLVAQASTATPHSPWKPPSNCRVID